MNFSVTVVHFRNYPYYILSLVFVLLNGSNKKYQTNKLIKSMNLSLKPVGTSHESKFITYKQKCNFFIQFLYNHINVNASKYGSKKY